MKNTDSVFYELQDLLKPYQPVLHEVVESVLNQDVSNYPIFVVHAIGEVEIGLSLIDDVGNSGWSARISTLEEFVAKQVITNEKVDDFRKLYKKQASKHFCCFVLSDSAMPNFLFLPKK